MIHPNARVKLHEVMGTQPKNGDFGIELEIEGDNLPMEVPGWSVKHEGSLRGNGGRTVNQDEHAVDMPHEYTSSRPVAFEALQSKLRVLHKRLTQPNVNVRLTDRASTHIHINMMAEEVRTVVGFIAIFCIIEPVLLRLCGAQRNGNLFCLPSYETGELPGFISKMANAILVGPRRSWPNKRGKYAALNTDPLTVFGTLEVRCFPNTADPDLIFKWASWLWNIRKLSASWEEPTYLSLIERVYNEPEWILQQVFENEPLLSACYPNNPSELILFGVEQGYEILKNSKHVFDFKEMAKPKKFVHDYNGFEPINWGSSLLSLDHIPEPFSDELDENGEPV